MFFAGVDAIEFSVLEVVEGVAGAGGEAEGDRGEENAGPVGASAGGDRVEGANEHEGALGPLGGAGELDEINQHATGMRTRIVQGYIRPVEVLV